jgi:hypothetical protein
MKAVYILLVIVLTAAALGCVGKKGPETSTKAPVVPAPTSQPSNTVSEGEVLDTNNDLTNMDAMFDESNLDISFSEVSADTFT